MPELETNPLEGVIVGTDLAIMPTSVDEALSELRGLGELVTAKEWHRAALVWMVTRTGGQGAYQQNRSSAVLTTEELAACGIVGLRSGNSVRRYRRQWQRALDAGYPEPTPGVPLMLPSLTWSEDRPAVGPSTPSTTAPTSTQPELEESSESEEVDNCPDLEDTEVFAGDVELSTGELNRLNSQLRDLERDLGSKIRIYTRLRAQYGCDPEAREAIDLSIESVREVLAYITTMEVD